MAKNTGTFYIVGPSLKPWINYLDRLSMSPSPEMQAELDAALEAATSEVAVNTHVAKPKVNKKGHVTRQGGRLLASLTKRSGVRRTVRRTVWEGEISLGEGVPYAKYETGERRRGIRPDWAVHPSHDPYDGLEKYYSVVDRILDRGI